MIPTITARISRDSLLTWSPWALESEGKHRGIAKDAWFFLSGLADESASHVVLAYKQGQQVGWFRFTLTRGRILYAQGTWVNVSFRRQGVAKKVWQHALNIFRPTVIHVDAVSPGGRALVRWVAAEYPNISFNGNTSMRAVDAHP